MTNNKFLQAARLWAAAAWADGVLADEERVGMAVILKLANLDPEDLATAMGWLEAPVDAGDLDVSDLDAGQREDMYASAARITTIDNEVADAERVFLARLRETLGIAPDRAAAILQEAGVD